MAGIYIHIPFCRQACFYCNFHFSTSLRYKNELIAALLKEIEMAPPISKPQIETIYFGGGTPSLLAEENVESILKKINSQFIISPGAEITLEANPDDITENKLVEWKETGITRLSIGIQSFFDEDLKWMNRAHNASQAVNSLQSAVRHFNNITIDLIYGTPGLTNEKWKQNVHRAIDLGIPHLSCYALTVEPKTPLQKMIQQHKSADIEPGKQSEQFRLLMQWMEKEGYEHYEISNFAKPGFRSRHNSSYWQGKNYFGFGPSAHSYDGASRWWNVSNNNLYIESINKNIIPFEKEELTITQKINEYIMTSLRTGEGMNLKNIKKIAEVNGQWSMANEQLSKKSRKYIEQGLMIQEDDKLILTKEGKLFADGIAADLFMDQ